MLTGIRGSGKTVMLTSLAKEFKKYDDWVVVELNPMKDMLLSLAAKLYSIKVMLEPLNINAIAKMYNQTLGISFEKSMKMAVLTKGYPFAFQVLGYLCWNSENKDDLNDIMPKYDQYLEEYVYEKIWSELSETDRRVVGELSQKDEVKIKEIRDELNMNSSEMSVYKSRLLKKGIISSTKYGYISLTLPRFAEIVQNWMMGEE